MKRKRDEMVTAGEASGSLGGPVKAIHSTPRPRPGTTSPSFDQVEPT